MSINAWVSVLINSRVRDTTSNVDRLLALATGW